VGHFALWFGKEITTVGIFVIPLSSGSNSTRRFLIIKPTRYTNFSNLFLEWNSTCFRQFLCPSSGVFHCTHSNGICHTGLLKTCKQDQDGTPDDGQRNCPKHVEFHSKNKFQKLVHPVGFIIRKFTMMHGHRNVKIHGTTFCNATD
jgi:hypothetical protein